jgi:hypothetical protein
MISFGSIVHRNSETLSVLEPAAPWEGAPGSSLASLSGSVRFRDPKLRSRRDIDIVLRNHRGQSQGGRPGRGAGRSGRGVLQNGEG